MPRQDTGVAHRVEAIRRTASGISYRNVPGVRFCLTLPGAGSIPVRLRTRAYRTSRNRSSRGLFLTTPHVVIINDDCVASGGAAGIALMSARVMQARGARVSYLAGDVQGGARSVPGDLFSLTGQHIMDGARGAAALRGLYDHNTRRSIEQWIQANDSANTIYHLHNWHKVLSPSAFAALRPVRDRLFISTHDYFLVCPNGGQFNYPRHRGCELRPMSSACVLTQCDRRHYMHKLWRVARTAMRGVLFDLAELEATVLAVHEGMIPYLVRGGIPRHLIRVLRNPVRRPSGTDRYCSSAVSKGTKALICWRRLRAASGQVSPSWGTVRSAKSFLLNIQK